MSKEKSSTWPEAFSFHSLGREFNEEFTKAMRSLMEREMANLVSPENSLHYTHGRQWMASEGGAEATEDGFVQHSHEMVLKLDDVIAHNIHLLPTHIAEIVTAMAGQFSGMIFQKVDEITERTGNVVNMKDFASPAQAMAEALQKIEFGIDKEGKPSLPSFHVGAQMLERLRTSIDVADKDLEERISKITEEKKREALAHEEVRLSRYRGTE